MDPLARTWQTQEKQNGRSTFDVESSSIFVPSFEADLVAQNGEETLEFFAAALCNQKVAIG